MPLTKAATQAATDFKALCGVCGDLAPDGEVVRSKYSKSLSDVIPGWSISARGLSCGRSSGEGKVYLL